MGGKLNSGVYLFCVGSLPSKVLPYRGLFIMGGSIPGFMVFPFPGTLLAGRYYLFLYLPGPRALVGPRWTCSGPMVDSQWIHGGLA